MVDMVELTALLKAFDESAEAAGWLEEQDLGLGPRLDLGGAIIVEGLKEWVFDFGQRLDLGGAILAEELKEQEFDSGQMLDLGGAIMAEELKERGSSTPARCSTSGEPSWRRNSRSDSPPAHHGCRKL